MKRLDVKWVESNFDQRFLSQIKNLSVKKAAFVSVPPGDDRHHNNADTDSLCIGPRIQYQQKENERTCMVYAFASAVHHAGGKQLASEIRNMAHQLEHKVEAFGIFIKWLRGKHKAVQARQQNPVAFELLNQPNTELILACIRGKDGKEDHCIAIYGGWIFDSNFEQALALSQASLDICCSSDDVASGFEGCTDVVTFPNIYMVHAKKNK